MTVATTTSLTLVGSSQQTFADHVSIIGLILKDATGDLQNQLQQHQQQQLLNHSKVAVYFMIQSAFWLGFLRRAC
jgi:hypothetical protein